MQKMKTTYWNDTYKAVDIVGIVNDGANLTLWTNSNRSKNIGTGMDKSIDLQKQQYSIFYHYILQYLCLTEAVAAINAHLNDQGANSQRLS